MEYTIKKFKDEGFYVQCFSQEEADELMVMLNGYGLRWSSKGLLTNKDNYWDRNGSRTYYCYDNGVRYGSLDWPFGDTRPEIVSFQKFANRPKSNKEKVFDMIGVEVEERFNIRNANCNPFYFDKWFDLRNNDYDVVNYMTAPILYENRLEKIIKNPNKDIENCIELLSRHSLPMKSIIDCIRVSLKEILELKESKSA